MHECHSSLPFLLPFSPPRRVASTKSEGLQEERKQERLQGNRGVQEMQFCPFEFSTALSNGQLRLSLHDTFYTIMERTSTLSGKKKRFHQPLQSATSWT